MAQPTVTVYKVLKTSQYRPKIRDVVQICSWNNSEPVVEIRRQFKNNTDEGWRMSHARGMKQADVQWFIDNLDEIQKYLQLAVDKWKEMKDGN